MITETPKGDMQPDLVKFAKARAKKLRAFLETEGVTINHSQSLEATAKMEGFKDWNTYCAHFKLAASSLAPKDSRETSTGPAAIRFPYEVGTRITGTYRGSPFEGTLLGLEQTITTGVWRAKMRFDQPVRLPGSPRLQHTRQQVRCMFDSDGKSVNLAGRPDGHVQLKMP